MAGETVTIADISLVATLTSCNVVVPINSEKYPKITAWIKTMEQLPYYNANKVGLDVLDELIKSKLKG